MAIPVETKELPPVDQGEKAVALNGTGSGSVDLIVNLDVLSVDDLVTLDGIDKPGAKFSDAVTVLERCIKGGVRHLNHKMLPKVMTALMTSINEHRPETKVTDEDVKALGLKVDVDLFTIGDLEVLESLGDPKMSFGASAEVLEKAVEGGIGHYNQKHLPTIIESVMRAINSASNPTSENGRGN